MASAETLSELLRCPETHQALSPLDASELEELNEAIRNGELTNEAGESVEETLDEGLVREDGTIVYPVRDGVPNLLLNDRIRLDRTE